MIWRRGGNFFLNGPHSNYFRLCRHIISVITIQLCFVRESSHSLHLKEWSWLGPCSLTKKDQAGFGSLLVVCRALSLRNILGTDLGLKQQIRSECGSPVVQGGREWERTEPGIQRTGFQPCVPAVQPLPIPGTSLGLGSSTVRTTTRMKAPPQVMGPCGRGTAPSAIHEP